MLVTSVSSGTSPVVSLSAQEKINQNWVERGREREKGGEVSEIEGDREGRRSIRDRGRERREEKYQRQRKRETESVNDKIYIILISQNKSVS